MGSKVCCGFLPPVRGLPTWVLLVLAFSLAWNRIEPQAVPSGCVLCAQSLLNILLCCVCVWVLWMDVFVCTRVVNIRNVVRAENLRKSFFIDLCVCDSMCCIITAGVYGNALTWCCTHRQSRCSDVLGILCCRMVVHGASGRETR
jgi:hypothetical protein